MAVPLRVDEGYGRLPASFYARLRPTPVSSPALVRLNLALARDLGLDPDALATREGVAILAGNRVPEGAEPLAMVYAGHQFGHFVPQLGDGRALLLGERTGPDGVRYEIQLKGSGPTPFSRRGDGRAALGPVLREYVVSEAMAALGIRTTRALAMVTTGDAVIRERELRGAILARVARSHVRVGTFEYFRHQGDLAGLRALADHATAHIYPELRDAPDPHRALLDTVIGRQAELIASWMCVGFIHGVMNTDNVSIAGETLDYGPCAFMDGYDPRTVYSSIDRGSRYAYERQPWIGHWNLTRFAEALLPLLAADTDEAVRIAQQALDAYPTRFERAYTMGLRRKLGLESEEPGDLELAQALLSCMAEHRADHTGVFRRLADAADPSEPVPVALYELLGNARAFDAWRDRWHARLSRDAMPAGARREAMRRVNPAYIPRNHRVEQAIVAAEQDDLAPLDTLLSLVTRPFDDHPDHADWARPPEPHEVVHQTFCGT